MAESNTPPHVTRRIVGTGVSPYTSSVGNAVFGYWRTPVITNVTSRPSARLNRYVVTWAKRAETVEDAGTGYRVDVAQVHRRPVFAGLDSVLVPTGFVKALWDFYGTVGVEAEVDDRRLHANARDADRDRQPGEPRCRRRCRGPCLSYRARCRVRCRA